MRPSPKILLTRTILPDEYARERAEGHKHLAVLTGWPEELPPYPALTGKTAADARSRAVRFIESVRVLSAKAQEGAERQHAVAWKECAKAEEGFRVLDRANDDRRAKLRAQRDADALKLLGKLLQGFRA